MRRPARGRHRMRRAQVNDDGAAGGRAAHRDRGGRQLDRERAARSGRYPPVAQPDGGGPPRRPVRAVRGRPEPGRARRWPAPGRGPARPATARREPGHAGARRSAGSPGCAGRSACATAGSRLVPAGDGHRQAGAPRVRAQRTHHQRGTSSSCSFIRCDAHRDVAGRQAERGDQLAAVELAGRFQPPQREQFPVTGSSQRVACAVSARWPDSPSRTIVSSTKSAAGIGHLVAELGHGRGLPGPVVLAHLPDRDRDQPGPERCRIAQAAAGRAPREAWSPAPRRRRRRGRSAPGRRCCRSAAGSRPAGCRERGRLQPERRSPSGRRALGRGACAWLLTLVTSAGFAPTLTGDVPARGQITENGSIHAASPPGRGGASPPGRGGASPPGRGGAGPPGRRSGLW